MAGSKISTLIFSAGNVFIAFTLIALVYMTRRDMPKVDKYDENFKLKINLSLSHAMVEDHFAKLCHSNFQRQIAL